MLVNSSSSTLRKHTPLLMLKISITTEHVLALIYVLLSIREAKWGFKLGHLASFYIPHYHLLLTSLCKPANTVKNPILKILVSFYNVRKFMARRRTEKKQASQQTTGLHMHLFTKTNHNPPPCSILCPVIVGNCNITYTNKFILIELWKSSAIP